MSFLTDLFRPPTPKSLSSQIHASKSDSRSLSDLLEIRQNPLNNPAVPLSGPSAYAWLAGGDPTVSGENVTIEGSLQIATVYTCVRIIAESVAAINLKLYERLDSGKMVAEDNDLYYLLNTEPNPEMTAFSFFEALTGSLALTGNAYAEIQRSGSTIIALWPLHPLKTEPIRIGKSIVYRTTDGESMGDHRDILPENIIAIPLFSFDGMKGYSPIQLARQEAGLAIAAQKFGSRHFANGGKPGGILSAKTPLSPQQLSEMRTSWAANQGGANQGKTAVLPGEWSYTPIGLSAEESQFLQSRGFTRATIAALFRIEPHMVGSEARLSTANHEQASLSFVQNCLKPYLSRIEMEFHRKLLPTIGRNASRFSIKYDLSERLRGDLNSTLTSIGVGRQWGVISQQEGRAMLGLSPWPGEDNLLRPLNMVVVGQEPTEPEPTNTDDQLVDTPPTKTDPGTQDEQ